MPRHICRGRTRKLRAPFINRTPHQNGERGHLEITINLTESEASTLVDFLEWSVDQMEEHLQLGGDHDDAREIYEPRIRAAMALREQVLSKAQQQ